MDWKVPTSPKYINIVGIPPIIVKVAVRKVQQLSQQI
jgi:hypothetical protein